MDIEQYMLAKYIVNTDKLENLNENLLREIKNDALEKHNYLLAAEARKYEKILSDIRKIRKEKFKILLDGC